MSDPSPYHLAKCWPQLARVAACDGTAIGVSLLPRMNERGWQQMDGWTDGRRDGWMDGGMGLIYKS